MAVAGRKGHIAILDARNMSLIKEFQVKETVRDVVCLHNELFFAAAQKKYPYIYNRDGVEVHCLKKHGTVRRLHFLKHHFLLASINKFGQLHYQDVSVGKMVGNLRTGFGRTDVMKVNPYNGVVALGHSNGTVTTWKPTVQIPLVKMLCHAGPVSALAFHPNGHLMATSGKERKIKIWDPRKFEVYSRYMNHSIVKGYQITDIMFRPYEDVLGIGHSMGWSSILIPGSGEANFDSWVANPFETPKQRREREIRALLDKLPPETIMLDPSKIGTVKDPRHKEKRTKKEMEEELEAAVEAVKGVDIKHKTKGKSKPSKQAKKKKEMKEKAKRPFLEQTLKEDQEVSRKKQRITEEVGLPKSLQRFGRPKHA